MATKPLRKPTAAEEAILAQFDRALPELAGNDNVRAARRAAMQAFERDGLPTRKVEAWHYTDLRTAIRETPAPGAGRPEAAPTLAHGSHVVDVQAVRGGKVVPGVTLAATSDRLAEGTFFVAPSRGFDTIGQINTAFAQAGAIIEVDDGVALEEPIELQIGGGAGQSHARNAVTVGAGARATVVERHIGARDGASLDTLVSDLIVGEGAEVIYVIVQARGSEAVHLGQLNATIGANARLTLFILQAGSKVARQEIHVEVLGEGADFQLRGVNLLGGEALTDTTMVVNHAVPGTTSGEVFRNVGTGRGRGVFQGQIKVAQVAQKTDAKMSCNTLLLSDDASFAAKPELEIFADDVACGHGATVDDLEPTQLFYLMARGIPEKQARALLVKGFVGEMLEALEPHEALSAALEARIDAWLEAHA